MMKVAWFSAGVSSFIASYLAKPDRILYIDVANQHPDSFRFLNDCQKHLSAPIEILRDIRYGASVDNVINDVKYLNSPGGAPCTNYLKKRVRKEWEQENLEQDTVYVFGYDVKEKKRAERVEDHVPEGVTCEFPLIDNGVTKEEAHAICDKLGILRPAMYELGYPNNNCIGCVKGSKGYWNHIRKDFPFVFNRRAKQERMIGHSCINGVFLDELNPKDGRYGSFVIPDCSFMCMGLDESYEELR